MHKNENENVLQILISLLPSSALLASGSGRVAISHLDLLKQIFDHQGAANGVRRRAEPSDPVGYVWQRGLNDHLSSQTRATELATLVCSLKQGTMMMEHPLLGCSIHF